MPTKFGRISETDYLNSNKILTIPGLIKLDKKLKEAIINDSDMSANTRMKLAQAVSNAITSALNISKIPIKVHQSHQLYKNKSGTDTLRKKTLGRYWHGQYIEIWNLTAKTQKVVSSKTFFQTLLHEICHHIDYAGLHISSSPHTKGFYMRISYLDQCFK